MASRRLIRREYRVRGVVQGVGFRPHVANVAARHLVTGCCGNDDTQVFIELQGSPATVDACAAEILSSVPPLALVLSVTTTEQAVRPAEAGFAIIASRQSTGARTLIPPDLAPCAACLGELRDSTNRRFGHPFITCTNCGPRLTIITDLPYDRPRTTMSPFAMCSACASEYANPADRRFHAQPISCFDCGPALWLVSAATATASSAERPATATGSREQQVAVVAEAVAALAAGEILAVKGVGGFHLICDATNEATVARLRVRKHRANKPFAVLVADLDQARELVRLSTAGARILDLAQRPIVIAPARRDSPLAASVAPGLGDVGVLLPPSPLHELLAASGLTLVATSANVAEEPLVHRNRDAIEQLTTIADHLLLHDRQIAVPVEDSVMLDAGGQVIAARRSRGHAPLPIPLPSDGPTVLAVGGELKNTCTLAHGDLAFMSAHVGDMGSWATQQAFDATVGQLLSIHRSAVEVVVCDLHPGYATTSWAQRYVDAHPHVRLHQVQHHCAHGLALLGEYGVHGTAVVATLDGTGYGTDQAIWGGEILAFGATSSSIADWQRVWQVPYFGLVGGDRAIRYPWRVAQGLAHSWQLSDAALCEACPPAERALVASQLASGLGVIQTSSVGRLFDAAAAFLGVCHQVSYEAQAAMELEYAASQADGGRTVGEVSDLREIFAEMLANSTQSVAERAWQFHHQLAAVIANALAAQAAALGTDQVGLTGGVAMNRLFTTALRTRLGEHGYELITHQVLPPNDGGLSFGQALAGRLP